VNSLPFELEAQLEHTAVDGRKLMVSTLFTPGKSNDLMERVAKNIPTLPDDTRDIDRANWIDLFP
jgi:carbonic anhydrase